MQHCLQIVRCNPQPFDSLLKDKNKWWGDHDRDKNLSTPPKKKIK